MQTISSSTLGTTATLAHQQMVWTINGRVYEERVVANDEMMCVDQPNA